MAMLVEPSRSVPGCPLATTDAPALPCGYPVAMWPTSDHVSGALGLDARGSNGRQPVRRGAGERGAGEHGAGEHGLGSHVAGKRQVKDRHDVDQTADDDSGTVPLRAAVIEACSSRPNDQGFAAWLHEVVRDMDNPTD